MQKTKYVEKNILHALQKGLKNKPIEFESVENENSAGFPDVLVKGKKISFIELKKIDSFPKKFTTKIKIPFRPFQFAWIKTFLKITKGDDIFLMILIGEMFFIFKNENIKEEYSFSELETLYVYFTEFPELDFKKIYTILTEGRK